MSQYSEMMGSFIRTGNYPLEANYIFPTVAALKEFYADPINATTLHKGLLRVVEDDEGLQGLYWVTSKKDSNDLLFTRLILTYDVDDMSSVIDLLQLKINLEIEERKSADYSIWGTETPSIIDEDLNSILEISTELINLRNKIEENLQQLVDKDEDIENSLKATVGTDSSHIVNYLSTLPYISLTEVSLALDKFLNTVDSSNTTINTLPELLSFLSGYDDSNKLSEILEDLYNKILGSPVPSEEFRTLRAIEDFIRIFKSDTEHKERNIQSELDLTQIGVGLSGDGMFNSDKSTKYLKTATSVMNALNILDSLIDEAINNCELKSSQTNTIQLNIDKYSTGTEISANVKLSSTSGNSIIAKSDGLYHNIKSTYSGGTLTLYVNDTIISQHNLGLSFIGINDAYYDTITESIIMVFNKENGTTDKLSIPVTNLIREWVVDNSGTSDVVILNRSESYGNGADKLSADVRLHSSKDNILTKLGNTLYVKGTADNITWNDVKVSILLDALDTKVKSVTEDLLSEINRAKESERDLQFTLEQEVVRATNKETQLLQDYISKIAEANNNIELVLKDINTANSSINELNSKLGEEILRAERLEQQLQSSLNTETLRAKSSEELLNLKIETLLGNLNLSNALQDNRLTSLEDMATDILQQLLTEVSRATSKEGSLESLILTEETRAKTVELQLSERIFINANNIVAAENKASLAVETSVESSKKVVEALIEIADFSSLISYNTAAIANEETRATALEAIINHKIEDLKESLQAFKDTIPDFNELSNIIDEVKETLESHIKDFNNPHQVNQELVGLENVDNISALDMPISYAVLSELDKKADVAQFNWWEG